MSELVNKFNKEVIAKGKESTLPVNLNNEWLEVISLSLDEILDDTEEDSDELKSTYMALVLQAVLHILMAKESQDTSDYSFEISTETLFKYFQEYRIEIALESIRRNTEIKSNPATIETIFTNREIGFTEGY